MNNKIIHTTFRENKCACGTTVSIKDFIEFQPPLLSSIESMDALKISFTDDKRLTRDFLRIGICDCGNIFLRKYDKYRT